MPKRSLTLRSTLAVASVLTVLGAAGAALVPPGAGLVATTLLDFEQPGTQPLEINADFEPSASCAGCHGNYDLAVEPYRRWASSMMAQSSRDPIFHAALAIAEQDADFAGDLCLRCHTPTAWVDGRSVPTDGSALDQAEDDFDGVTCHLCHRMVDPVYDAAANPPEDAGILAALSLPPALEPHTGQYVIDPEDRRRGPFDLGPSFFWHDWRQSPFHKESLLCATCHDVSNPAFVRQPDGTYDLGTLDAPHPTQDKTDEFPIERTFSEWSRSVYAVTPIETNGRFGGNDPAVSTCQDCHMPTTLGTACLPGLDGAVREDLPLHDFNGANSWVLRAVRATYPDNQTGLSASLVDDAVARNIQMLRNAADLHAFVANGQLVVRVVNQTGHKLPTGYGEGRRMWINIRFLDAGGNLVAERGPYNDSTAILNTGGTRVWEIEHGLDADLAAATGIAEGPSFHFVLNNAVYKDNRIPPRGYNISAFEGIQAAPVGQVYLQEQYWDDVSFAIPAGSVAAQVRINHQTTSKDYIEFLRDANTTNATGQAAYDLWAQFGKSRPVRMASVTVDLTTDTCTPPIPYGLGKELFSGKRVELSGVGDPSASAGNFAIHAQGGPPNQLGVLFYANAPRSSPHFGGTLLVQSPLRGPVVHFDANGETTIPISIDAGMVGDDRYYQLLFRDPGGSFNLGQSEGLYVNFCE